MRYLDKRTWSCITLIILHLCTFSGIARAQSTAQAAAMKQIPGAGSGAGDPGPKIWRNNVNPARGASPAHSGEARLEIWMIATVAPSTGLVPVSPAIPRISFKPAVTVPSGPLVANPTFRSDMASEPIVDTSHVFNPMTG